VIDIAACWLLLLLLLQARAVVVDMEEGVIQHMLKVKILPAAV
jgi:hypothetical protein